MSELLTCNITFLMPDGTQPVFAFLFHLPPQLGWKLGPFQFPAYGLVSGYVTEVRMAGTVPVLHITVGHVTVEPAK